MAAQPWLKWWVGDWRRSPKVAQLSAEARGVWREMIDVMHELNQSFLEGNVQELSNFCRVKRSEMRRSLVELQRWDIATIEEKKGGIYHIISRRRVEIAEKQEYERVKKQGQRAKEKKEMSLKCPPNVPLSDSDSDSNNKRKVSKFKKPKAALVEEYFSEKDSTSVEAGKFFDYYEANGWRVGKNPMKNWQAAASGWIRRSREYAGANGAAPKRRGRSCDVCGTDKGVIDDGPNGQKYCIKCYPVGATA